MRLTIRPRNDNLTAESVAAIKALFDRSRMQQKGILWWELSCNEWDEFERITGTRSLAAFVDWLENVYETPLQTEWRMKHPRPHLKIVR